MRHLVLGVPSFTIFFLAVACGSTTTNSAGAAPGDPRGGGDGGPSTWNGTFGPLQVLATQQNAPRRLATSASQVFWTGGPRHRSGTNAGRGYVRSIAKSGNDVETLAKDLQYPLGIAKVGDALYFTSYNLDGLEGWKTGLRRVPVVGGTVETVNLAPTGRDPQRTCFSVGPTELRADQDELLAGYDQCGFDLRSTPAEDVMDGSLQREGEPTSFGARFALTTTTVFAWRLLGADRVLVSYERGALPAKMSKIATVPNDATGDQVIEVEKERSPIAASGSFVYAGVSERTKNSTVGDGQMLRIGLDGSVELMARYPEGMVTSVAVDARNVYYTVTSGVITCTESNGAVYAAPLDGSAAPLAITSKLACPRDVAVDEDGVYFTELGLMAEEADSGPGRVLRLPKQ